MKHLNQGTGKADSKDLDDWGRVLRRIPHEGDKVRLVYPGDGGRASIICSAIERSARVRLPQELSSDGDAGTRFPKVFTVRGTLNPMNNRSISIQQRLGPHSQPAEIIMLVNDPIETDEKQKEIVYFVPPELISLIEIMKPK